MKKLFIFIYNLSYLISVDLDRYSKIKIMLNWFNYFLLGEIYNLLWKKSIHFNWYKIYWLNFDILFVLFSEIFIKNEYKFSANSQKPTIIDLGANIWMATTYFKWIYPNSEIFAFEPDHKHYNILKKNVSHNKLSNVSIYNKAITDYDWKIDFYTDNESSLIMSTKIWRMSKIKTEVDCLSFSKFIWNKKIDLVKMDIEWWELSVLKDLDKNNKFLQIENMIIEYHHNIPWDSMRFSTFLEILERNNFKYQIHWITYPINVKNQFQDVLIHAYK